MYIADDNSQKEKQNKKPKKPRINKTTKGDLSLEQPGGGSIEES